ncbi:erg24, C-14 sterol reductase [Neofusicoccum ribis]|uniref:Delta(14)-sterol reductase n=1 Tax=Neofusicoccum ribis TaxID=45134 RepID=A0ABR3T276_9PEZI
MSQLKERKPRAAQPAAPSGPHEEPHPMEFGGPLGAFGISFGLPILCFVFAFFVNDTSGCPPPSLLQPKTFSLDKLKDDVGWQGFSSLINAKAFAATIGYYLFSLTLNAVLPATKVDGIELRSAFLSAIVTLGLLAAGTFVYGAEFPVWTFIWDNYAPILSSNILISYALAIFVYVRSFQVKPGNNEKRELAAGGHSGNMLYDWFIGRELNPRVTLPFFGEIDIKTFMELRPGMLGWVILDLTFMARQYHNYGKITVSILIVTFSQAFYVLDALYMEPAILTTMDIIMDGFGLMLSFGDLVWVPFAYSLQARYLAIDPKVLSYPEIAAILGIQAFGYYIFRSSNNEKNRFRTNPNDPKIKHLKYMETSSGSKLLISGWWGTARHINYLGDWFMSWAYCLPTGVAGYLVVNHSTLEVVPGEARGWGTLITYFYMIYFAILLIHREGRDEDKCKKKYGKDWEAYCKKVPYRILPYVY